jgi:hypothetical protein
MSAPGRKVYVVQIRSGYYGPSAKVEGVFADRADAEACLVQCERALRPTLRYYGLFWDDPHTCRNILDLTNFELPILLDWLHDADIPLPANPEYPRSWDAWWEEQRESLTEDQLSHLFAGLHRLTFHRIVEVDLIDNDAWDPLLDVSNQTGVPLTGAGPREEYPDVEPTDEELPIENLDSPPSQEGWVQHNDDEIPF